MEKKKLTRWIAPLALGLGFLALGSNFEPFESIKSRLWSNKVEYSTTIVDPSSPIHASSSVNITDKNLKNALLELLGKNKGDTLYHDDFINHDNYKAITTTDEVTGISTTTAKLRYLNLSGKDITNIYELCQFEFPETLKAIDLSNNKITNAHLNDLTAFLDLSNSTQSEVTYKDKTYYVRTDIINQISKVNLTYNNIDLNTLHISTLNNDKLLFGIQCMPSKITSFVSDDSKPKYYIRENDVNYLSYTFTSSLYEGNLIYNHNTIEDLLPSNLYGKYTITVKPKTLSESNYFFDESREYPTYTIRFFDVRIDEDFWVERKSMLNLNNKLTWFGFDDLDNKQPLKFEYSNASTNEATSEEKGIINFTTITFTTPEGTKTVSREFIVKDTIKPVIVLNGTAQEYFSQNDENYKDLGATAYDPITPDGDTGDDISHRVSSSSTVKINILGNYTITYNCSDGYGNNATPVVRNISIVKRALSSITTHPNNDKHIVGELLKFTVKPNSGINIDDYSTLTYYWYLDGESQPFYECNGNNINGQGVCEIEFNETGKHTLKVILKTTQKADGAKVEKWANDYIIEVEANISDNDAIVIACAVAIGFILLIIGIIAYIKKKKKAGKTHKHKNFHKKKKDKSVSNNSNQTNNTDIKVIKNYTGEGTGKADPPILNNQSNDDNNDTTNKPLV